MKHNFLSYAGGLGLIAGALLLPSASQAQGFCYLVDADGQVVNLDDLCQSESDTEPLPGQPPTEASDVGEAQVESQTDADPDVRSYTIIGPVVDPESEAAPDFPEVDFSGPEPIEPDLPEVDRATPEPESPGEQMNSEPESGLPDSEG